MSELGPLRTIAVESGDVDLFPEPVLRLYDEGKRHAAQQQLLRLARTERDPKRRAQQQLHAADLQLWPEPVKSAPTMFTLNGFGTRIYRGAYGVGKPAVGVLWLTALFVPVVPLGAYLVTPSGNGYLFHARIPLPRSAQGVPAAWAAGIALLIFGVVLPSAWWGQTHVDVVAYNGFDVPVLVAVGGDERTVEPSGHVRFAGVPTEPTLLSASTTAGRALESVEVDLSGHGAELGVYNVLGRGLLTHGWIRYGEGHPPESASLPPLSFQLFDHVDYAFEEPPVSKKVSAGGHLDNSLLEATDLDEPDPRAAYDLLVGEFPDHALAVLEAEWRLRPEQHDLVVLAATERASRDPEAAAAWASGLREEFPDDPGAHVAYQFASGLSNDQLVTEYTGRVEAEPDRALWHYLRGRLEADPALALKHYDEALTRDPTLLPALQGAAARRGRLAEWPVAADLYRRCKEAGDDAASTRRERVRLASVLGADPSPLLTADTDGGSLRMADFFELDRAPDHLEAVWARVLSRGPLGEEDARWLESEVRLVAGDLAGARAAVVGGVAPLVSLRLALSDGATPEDRQAALALLDPDLATSPAMTVLSWGVVTAAAPERHAAWEVAMDRAGLGFLPAVLDAPGVTKDPRLLDALLLGKVTTDARGAIYAVMAFRTDRADYRALARRFALPQERPYLRSE